MANQEIYREPGVAGGLPLPRARLVPLTIVLALIAFTAIAQGPALLVVTGRSVAGAWRLFREGGLAMWLLLLADLGAPMVVAGLGAFVLRGKRLPAGLLFALAALPFAIALLGAWWGQRMVVGAISGESIDPEQKARILAEGVAESMAADIFGGYVASGIAITAAAAAAFALASIDVGAITRRGPKPSSFGTVSSGVAGAAWLLATLVLGIVRVPAAGGLVLLTVLPVVVLAPLAVLASRGASVLRTWHDRAEASRAAGALLVAAVSALLAVLVLERAIDATFTAQALGAISGESVDQSQRARILAYALDGARLAPVAFAIQAVLGSATFALALVPALGKGRHPVTASAALAIVAGAALVTGALALAHARTTAPRTLLVGRGDLAADGVTLPVVVETFSHRGSGGGDGAHVIVKADGTGEGRIDPSSCRTHVQLKADRAASVAMLRARVGAPELVACPLGLVLAVRREHPKDLDARLGYLAGYLGTRADLPFTMNARLADADARSHEQMRVVLVADDAVEIDGVRRSLPLGASAAPAPGSGSVTRIEYVFRPSDTIDRVTQTMAAVESAYDANLATGQLERFLDDGARPPPPPPPTPSFPPWTGSARVLAGSVTVNGRLPTELIQRIVRQHQGRMRLCYENGLRKDPALRGRVSVKFVIDRSGSVSTAVDGGSDLPDREVVACVVRAFGNISFPQPEGGIVTVVYPLVFSAAP